MTTILFSLIFRTGAIYSNLSVIKYMDDQRSKTPNGLDLRASIDY